MAEDYAPFQIDVTTEQPASLAPGTTMKVVVGGGGAWTGGTYGGIAYVGSFRTGPNVAFVFPANLGGGYAKYVGDASSHEAGHGFGLKHQSSYNSSGIKTADYSTGPGDGTAPLMGNSYSPRRSLWWYGPTTSVSTFQNDLSVISSTNNGFGYRSDEAGDSASTAAPLTLSGTSASASGIITTMSDLDYYSFSTDPGTVTFTVTVPASVSNLSPKLELRGADGATLIASAGPIATDFSASISVSLPAGGSYRLVVASNGRSSSSTTSNYGFNVGQYSLSGTIVTSAGAISTPTGLTATNITTTCIDLSWTDNAGNETGYRVERSSNGTTWSQLGGDLPANTVSYSDTSASAGTTYSYRVRAFNASATSSYSALATATTVPLAPANLIGTAAASNRVDLSWTDVTGETGYLVERSLDGTTWSQVGTVGQGVTSYSDSSVSPNTAYRYRARAANAGGSSDPSNQVTVTTPAASQALAAPSNLQATAVTRSRVDLTWTDNSSDETGFRIERSTTNGRSWSLIATVGRDVTSYSNTTVSRNRTYSYRVRAYKGTTYSAYSNVVVVTTPSASTSNAPLNEGLAILSPTGGEARWSAAASTVASPRLLAVDEALAAWDAQMGGLTAIATMGAKRARK
ncbi:MAG: fibronectin type III domain-containing protein [Isosphaeraceae bacterium]